MLHVLNAKPCRPAAGKEHADPHCPSIHWHQRPLFLFVMSKLSPRPRLKVSQGLRKVFARRERQVSVSVGQTKDVPNFIRELNRLHREAAKSSLHFG